MHNEDTQNRLIKQSRLILSKIKRKVGKELTNQDIPILLTNYSLHNVSEMKEHEIEELHDRMTRLTITEMDLINLRHWCGRTLDEIGTIFGQDRVWAHRNLNKAYEKMRK